MERKFSFNFILGVACTTVLTCAPLAAASKRTPLYERASQLLLQNKVTAAINLLSKGIIDNPTCSELYQLRGEILWATRQFDIALSDAEKSIRYAKNKSSKASGFLLKAKAENFLKQDADAERDFNTAIELESRSYMAHVAYGQFLMTRNRNEEAIKQFQKAKELAATYSPNEVPHIDSYLKTAKKKDDVLTYKKIDEYMRTNQIDKAFGILDKEIIENPEVATLYHLRALAYSAQRRYALVIKDQEKVIQLSKDDLTSAKAYLQKALAEHALNQDEKAEASFKKSLELYPILDEAHLEYGKFLYGKGDNENAAEHLEQAIRSPANRMSEEKWSETKEILEKIKNAKETKP